ncbi:MAG: HAMP domain-containing histidine kinase [Deltaproteobacteria bacterium]|nr:HAMP domain-containing histidine kinase [Deltaproteobacteria bacterium]
MKLRARLALTLGLATISLLVLMGWAQSRWRSQLRVEALAGAAVHRMGSGGRQRCEANPESWPGPQGAPHARRRPGPSRQSFPRHRVFAYDTNLRSRNPDSPTFPPELAQQLRAGNDIAAYRSEDHRRTQVAVRMPWDEGPCAVVLMRAKGPPPWFSGAVLMPAVLVALVMILVALLSAGPVVRRVRQLTESVRKLGSGSEEPIHVDGNDEIAELGAAFEQSRQTIQAQLQSVRDREAALRNYIANTTHDVMLPLTVLQGHLVSLQQRIEAGEALDAKAFVPSIEESQYLGSLLHNLNAAARLEANEGLAHRDPLPCRKARSSFPVTSLCWSRRSETWFRTRFATTERGGTSRCFSMEPTTCGPSKSSTTGRVLRKLIAVACWNRPSGAVRHARATRMEWGSGCISPAMSPGATAYVSRSPIRRAVA